METRGFQFNAPAAARLSGVQGPNFGFASGESLVADPGIDIWVRGQEKANEILARGQEKANEIWMQGQQQATENLLSGINIGVKGLSEGVMQRFKQDYEKDLEKEKAKREAQSETNKFLRDVYLADLKSEDKDLKNTLTQLQIDKERREAAALDFYDPLPEMAKSSQRLAKTAAPDEEFSAGTTGTFSAGLGETQAPSQPVDGTNLQAEFVEPGKRPSRFTEQDLGNGKTALFDNVTRKIVPGTLSDKEETGTNEPVPEGYTKEQFTKKTKQGTETYKRQGEGKELTSEMVTKLSQFDSVKMSMNEIKETMKGIDRGPITGFLREKNPYDVDAQYLNKLVESVVPGLARTVFGEVGVLTDADVKRYKEMVPNMKTEEQVAEALIKMLDKKIDSSYAGYIKTAKKAGFDVSGFEAAEEEEKKATDKTAAQSGLYDEIKALRNQVANTSVVDTNRQALIQSIAAKTKEYIQKTGQSPKF